MRGSKGSKYGIGLLEICIGIWAVLFILKICGVKIPWIWVFSPGWIPILAVIIWNGVWQVILYARQINEKRKRRKWQ